MLRPTLRKRNNTGVFIIAQTLKWVGGVDGVLELIDQRVLPGDFTTLKCRTIEQVYDAIRTLAVRGAPAIGVAAGYGLVLIFGQYHFYHILWRKGLKKFVIKVYACGLYLKDKTNNADVIINNDAPMAIKMHFMYKNVPKEKLIKAWNDGFKHYKNKERLVKEIDKFNSLFKYDAKKNDIYELVYTPRKGVDVIFNNKIIGTVGGSEFKKALFSIWLGEKTDLPKLKVKLLGN